MKKLISLEYAAGIFDGEGSFMMGRTRNSYQGFAALGLREKCVVDALCSRFGGFVRRAKARQPQHADSWRWLLTGPCLLKFCQMMRTRLFIKHHQCQLIEELQMIKIRTGNRPPSNVDSKRENAIYQRIRKLNRKGPRR